MDLGDKIKDGFDKVKDVAGTSRIRWQTRPET